MFGTFIFYVTASENSDKRCPVIFNLMISIQSADRHQSVDPCYMILMATVHRFVFLRTLCDCHQTSGDLGKTDNICWLFWI